jgi:hypothetical protein
MLDQVTASLDTRPAPLPKPTLVVTGFYRAVTAELECRRMAVGLSMEMVSELAGTADRSYAKMLSPEKSAGRAVRWETLEEYIGVLYPDGYEVRVIPTRTGAPTFEGTRRRIMLEAKHFDRKTRREHMAEIGRKGQAALIARYTPEQRSAFGRKAAKTLARKRKANP